MGIERNIDREVRKRHMEGMAANKEYQTDNHYRLLEFNIGHKVSHPGPKEPLGPELGMQRPPSLWC